MISGIAELIDAIEKIFDIGGEVAVQSIMFRSPRAGSPANARCVTSREKPACQMMARTLYASSKSYTPSSPAGRRIRRYPEHAQTDNMLASASASLSQWSGVVLVSSDFSSSEVSNVTLCGPAIVVS